MLSDKFDCCIKWTQFQFSFILFGMANPSFLLSLFWWWNRLRFLYFKCSLSNDVVWRLWNIQKLSYLLIFFSSISLACSAAFLMNCFARSLQAAGTVSTHLMSSASISWPRRQTSFMTWLFKYLIVNEKTFSAGNCFPVSSDIRVLPFNVWKNARTHSVHKNNNKMSCLPSKYLHPIMSLHHSS